MRTSEPILTRGRDNWDRVNMPVSAFHDRISRVRGAMDRENVDVLVLYGTGDRDGDIAYVSNLVHKVPGFPLALVVTADTLVVINQRSSRTRPIVERSTWAEDVRFTRNLWADLDGVLAEIAGSDDEIGFVGTDAMAHPAHERLDELGSSWSIEVRDGFLDEVRAVKDERELDQIRRSGRILRKVDGVFAESIGAPIRERALAAELDRVARLHGAQDFRLLISNPSRTEGAHRPAEDFTIGNTEPISLYLAARFEGYWSSLSRTTTLNGTSGSISDLEAVEGVLDDLIHAIEPGSDVGSAVHGARVSIERLGLEFDSRYRVLTGLGLELDEPPVVPANDQDVEVPVEPGMCFEVSLPVTGGDHGPMLVGETVVVTERGAERVTSENER